MQTIETNTLARAFGNLWCGVSSHADGSNQAPFEAVIVQTGELMYGNVFDLASAAESALQGSMRGGVAGFRTTSYGPDAAPIEYFGQLSPDGKQLKGSWIQSSPHCTQQGVWQATLTAEVPNSFALSRLVDRLFNTMVQQAATYNQHTITLGHLWLALLQLPDVKARLPWNADAQPSLIAKFDNPQSDPLAIALAPELKAALRRAYDEAQSGTEIVSIDILLASVYEANPDVFADVAQTLNIDAEQVLIQVEQLPNDQPDFPSLCAVRIGNAAYFDDGKVLTLPPPVTNAEYAEPLKEPPSSLGSIFKKHKSAAPPVPPGSMINAAPEESEEQPSTSETQNTFTSQTQPESSEAHDSNPNASAHSNAKGGAKKKGLAAVLVVLLAKWNTFVTISFKALGLLKAKWLLGGIISFGASLVGWSMLWGWQFGACVLALIFAHEMGHFLYMKYKGFDPKAPIFIPFMGAFVAMDKLPSDRMTLAWMSLWGPIAGGAVSATICGLGMLTHNQFLLAVAAFGLWINLFQLMPARPFDGGFIVDSVSKWLLIPGCVMFLGAAVMYKSTFLAILSVLGVLHCVARFRGKFPEMTEGTTLQRVLMGVIYLGLAGALGGLYAVDMAAITVKHPMSKHTMTEKAEVSDTVIEEPSDAPAEVKPSATECLPAKQPATAPQPSKK